MMTDQEILERGYHEYRPTPFHSDGIEKCFQKRFRDKNGNTRYFIDVNKWKGWKHPHTGEIISDGYEYSLQMYQKETHNPVDLLFHNDWDLEDVENFVEAMFQTGWFDYYEKEECDRQ